MTKLKTLILNNQLATAVFTPLWHLYKRLTTGYKSIEDLPGRIHYNDIYDSDNLEHYKAVSIDALKNIEKSLSKAKTQAQTTNTISNCSDTTNTNSNTSDTTCADTTNANTTNPNTNLWDNVGNCLIFPSGYGRELRMIATKISPGKITCSDINKRAVNFCVSEFGVTPFMASQAINSICLPEKYSLIWCGSLFTHLPENLFIDLFNLLANALKPDGILIFTTHERESLNRLKHYGAPMPAKNLLEEKFNKGEFTFTPYEWSDDYGISISPKSYVLNLNEKYNSSIEQKSRPLKLIRYKEEGWNNHQSVFTFQKS